MKYKPCICYSVVIEICPGAKKLLQLNKFPKNITFRQMHDATRMKNYRSESITIPEFLHLNNKK